jgi:hypothetical protein
MLGPRGNPQARNLFGIIGGLQNRPRLSCTSRRRALSAAGRRR